MSRPSTRSPPVQPSPSLPNITILETSHKLPPPPEVVVPILSKARRALFSSMAESAARDQQAMEALDKIDEVVGYVKDNGVEYYYGRREGGMIRRWESRLFKEKHQHLIDEFERKKANGELNWFDPTSTTMVHPKSRLRLSIHLRATPSAKSDAGDTEAAFSEAQDEPEESDDEDDAADDEEYGEDGTPERSTRRSTRHGGADKPRELPFSPRKTRSQKIYTIDSDSDGEGEGAVQTRRSTRSKKAIKLNLDTDYADSDAEDSDEYVTTSKRGKAAKPRVKRAKAARPAYGFIRPIADIDLDPLSDEETFQLRQHRRLCEKCHLQPAHEEVERLSKKKRKGGRRKKKNEDEFEDSDDEVEREMKKGGWVRCLKCAVSAHFGCLASAQRDEILKAAKERDTAQWVQENPDADPKDGPTKRKGLQIDETTDFICGSCMKGGICMNCNEMAILPGGVLPTEQGKSEDVKMADPSDDVEMADGTKDAKEGPAEELLFRCLTCKRAGHYEHLPPPEIDSSPAETAYYYQVDTRWLCDDCHSFIGKILDKIIAWRPYPSNAIQPSEPVNYKDNLPREYLVKWEGRSYRRTEWVPHMWLLSTSPAKLKNFLAVGTKVDLLDEATARKRAMEEASEHMSDVEETPGPDAGLTLPTNQGIVDAESRIPKGWKTVDRVLDFILWNPHKPAKAKGKGKAARKGKKKRVQRIESDEEEEEDEEVKEIREKAFEDGEEPPEFVTETLEEWEARNKRKFTVDDIDDVVWAFIKWQDLGYDEATWDAPPQREDSGYDDFKRALERNLLARTVKVPKKMPQHVEDRKKDGFTKHRLKQPTDLKIGQDPALKLMPFQVDGFNWLCDNWWNHQPCILADEMGLGKTVQVSSFVGNIVDKWDAFPVLVVVPNSTLTNWVREFERWAPNLRVVPYYGEAKARQIIQRYKLTHPKAPPGCTEAKFHVLVTSYEAVTHKTDFGGVFKKQPRWEVLIIDEGQRLKNDKSLLFTKLNELKAKHRVIMTGTPLNNNIRELFNLMNFLDPDNWSDLEALETEYEELTEDLVKQLHDRLRPYFLRRIKSEVLTLPPKNEVIVPVSMTPIQKELYRSILSKNVDILNELRNGAGNMKQHGSRNVKNMLMQLRKCLQHPYLYDGEIEPKGLPPQEAHHKLIDASAKLRLLKSLLPKLKARGHRVLIFSQFVINLNIIEDFLAGEGYNFLRLDGNTKGLDRQKAMDEFNRPDSETFIFMLTTRAGGVGINLYSADTVIIYDPDFNPHQDLQAIARAHRFGQQKTCLVFKLMVKDSAEERIIQVGKKKLVLDHLIVQKINDDDEASENVQSILTYGAQALFEESAEQAEARNVSYSDHDLDKLIERTEQEGEEEVAPKGGGMSFAFAKIWAADKEDMVEVNDAEQDDSWAQALEKINAEREKMREAEIERGGRGQRRAAAMAKPTYYVEDTPTKAKGKGKATDASSSYGSDLDDDAIVTDTETGASAISTPGPVDPDKPRESKPKKRKRKHADDGLPSTSSAPPPAHIDDPETCGLCNQVHGVGECALEQSPENMFELREMLMSKDLDTDEPLVDRLYAISLLEERIHKMNLGHKLVGQPLHYVPPRKPPPLPSKHASSSSAPLPDGTGKKGRGRPRKSETNAVAGPSKRPQSPNAPAPPAKKAKVSVDDELCGLCEPIGAHTYGKCPVVAQGPKRVSQEIQRLDAVAGKAAVVSSLRSILKKQKKAELAKAAQAGAIEL